MHFAWCLKLCLCLAASQLSRHVATASCVFLLPDFAQHDSAGERSKLAALHGGPVAR